MASGEATSERPRKPVVVLLIGMAGAGKTSLMQRVISHVRAQRQHSAQNYYALNLDPAVLTLPYTPNIDIRRTVNYKAVMQQFNLGPNGAIVTALNLFATKFDQVLTFIEKRSSDDSAPLDFVFIDTPGQIEIFNWSASGQIIIDTLASSFPTVVVYVVDTPRSTDPTTFMSNMLYACGILYKTRLPFVVAFNKCDAHDHSFAHEWMTDYEAYRDDIRSDTGYMSGLTSSMALVLEEFYRNLQSVGVSAATGVGMDEFFAKLKQAKQEYYDEYLPLIQQRIQEKKELETKRREKNLARLQKDLQKTKGHRVVLEVKSMKKRSDDNDDDDDDDVDEDVDVEEEGDEEISGTLAGVHLDA